MVQVIKERSYENVQRVVQATGHKMSGKQMFNDCIKDFDVNSNYGETLYFDGDEPRSIRCWDKMKNGERVCTRIVTSLIKDCEYYPIRSVFIWYN